MLRMWMAAVTVLGSTWGGIVGPVPQYPKDDPRVRRATPSSGPCVPIHHGWDLVVPDPHPPPVEYWVDWDLPKNLSDDPNAKLWQVTPKPVSMPRFPWQADEGPMALVACVLHIDGTLSDCRFFKPVARLAARALRDIQTWRFSPAARCSISRSGKPRALAPRAVRISFSITTAPRDAEQWRKAKLDSEIREALHGAR